MTGTGERSVLFSERFRRYITFRAMTVFVGVWGIWNVGFSMFMKQSLSHLPRKEPWLGVQLHSPYFLVVYNLAVVVGFWIIYATRKRAEYYQHRVVWYGMLLGGIVGEVLYRMQS